MITVIAIANIIDRQVKYTHRYNVVARHTKGNKRAGPSKATWFAE